MRGNLRWVGQSEVMVMVNNSMLVGIDQKKLMNPIGLVDWVLIEPDACPEILLAFTHFSRYCGH